MNRSRRPSDYSQGRPGNATVGPNDAALAQKSNPVSDFMNNDVIIPIMDQIGFDGRRKTGVEDNDFYRDNAHLMPGFNINGIPSGAYAQDRATNHVGHGAGRGNPWDNIRRGLVENESARMDANEARTGDARLGFGDVFDAHVDEYARAGGGGNQFIDPGSFALAVYGAPLLEAVGLDSGPLTGLSIDIMNNPDDSAFEGWVKRMGLGAAEMGAGAMLGPMGFPLMALGAGGMLWNTATAIGGPEVAEWMGDKATGALNVAGDVMDTVGNGIGSAINGVKDFGGSIVDGVGSLFSW